MTNYYNKDLYKVLNISYEATLDEIKQSYRKLVRQCHPDVTGHDGNSRLFKQIQEAYEVLSNEDQRKKYDVLHGYYRERMKKTYEARTKYEETLNKAKKNANKSESFSKSINSALDNLFNTKSSYTRKPTKEKVNHQDKKPIINGEDINLDVTISCFESVNGTNRKVNILHTQPCPRCEGRKFINGNDCPECKGVGQLSVQKKLNVKIPSGVKQGAKIRIKKEGNKGQNGGKDGDLYLIVQIEKNPYFEIDGNNILCNLPISPTEAVFGAEVPINILNNKVTVKIPAMTSSGQKLKLTGLGLDNKTKTKKGDIIITVQIKLPKNLSEAEKDLYKKISAIEKSDIRKDMQDVK